MPSTRSKLGAKSSHNTIYIQLQLVACDNNVKEKVNNCSKIFHQDYFFTFAKIIITNKKLCPTQIQGFLMKRIFLIFLMFFMFSYAHAGLSNLNFQKYKVNCVLVVYNDKDVERKAVTLDISTANKSIYQIECKELGIDCNMNEDIPFLMGPDQKQYVTTDNVSYTAVIIDIENDSYSVSYVRPKGKENVNHSLIIQDQDSSYNITAALIVESVSWLNNKTNKWVKVQVTSSVTYEDDLIYQFLYNTGSKDL